MENKKKDLLKILGKFFALILGGTLLALILSKFFAAWALVLLYGEVIAPYTDLFIPVLFVAVLIAVNASLFSVCTLMREIKSQYIIGIAGLVSAFLLSVTVVKKYSCIGTVWAFLGTLLIQIAVQMILIVRKVRKMDGTDK